MGGVANQCALCDYSAITPRLLRHSVPQKIGRCAITPRLLRDYSAITPRVHISKTRSECNMRSTQGHAGNGAVCHVPIKTQWILPTSRFKLTMLNLNGGIAETTPNLRLTQMCTLPVKILRGMGASRRCISCACVSCVRCCCLRCCHRSARVRAAYVHVFGLALWA